MKKLQTIAVIATIIIGLYFIFRPVAVKPVKTSAPDTQVNTPDMKLESPVFVNYGAIPKMYTCDGDKQVPALSISGIPKGTVTLAIIMDDPDAPGGTFTHWVMFNIPPTVSTIDEKIPEGVQQGANSTGKEGYVAPCPESGTHRYFFTLYALDTKLGLDGKATKKDIEAALHGHILEQSLLIGVY